MWTIWTRSLRSRVSGGTALDDEEPMEVEVMEEDVVEE